MAEKGGQKMIGEPVAPAVRHPPAIRRPGKRIPSPPTHASTQLSPPVCASHRRGVSKSAPESKLGYRSRRWGWKNHMRIRTMPKTIAGLCRWSRVPGLRYRRPFRGRLVIAGVGFIGAISLLVIVTILVIAITLHFAVFPCDLVVVAVAVTMLCRVFRHVLCP